jgi:hypothetical protein
VPHGPAAKADVSSDGTSRFLLFHLRPADGVDGSGGAASASAGKATPSLADGPLLCPYLGLVQLLVN